MLHNFGAAAAHLNVHGELWRAPAERSDHTIVIFSVIVRMGMLQALSCCGGIVRELENARHVAQQPVRLFVRG